MNKKAYIKNVIRTTLAEVYVKQANAELSADDIISTKGVGSALADFLPSWYLNRSGRAVQLARAMGEQKPELEIHRPVTSALAIGLPAAAVLGGFGSSLGRDPRSKTIAGVTGTLTGLVGASIFSAILRRKAINRIKAKYDSLEQKPTGENYKAQRRQMSAAEAILLPVSGNFRSGMEKTERILKTKTPANKLKGAKNNTYGNAADLLLSATNVGAPFSAVRGWYQNFSTNPKSS